MTKKILLILALLLAFSLIQGRSRPQQLKQFPDEIDQIISQLTLEEKVGQLFMVGFPRTDFSPELAHLIDDLHIGSFILFERNIADLEQLGRLTTEMQEAAQKKGPTLPLLISTDQEGGLVDRLPIDPKFPSAMALGATNDPDLSFRLGLLVGARLRSVGINMNLAPVMDVNSNPANPVIGLRSYGEDPELVARLANAYSRGLKTAGIMATAKHFPGHGDTNIDSHYGLPLVDHPRTRLDFLELLPFRRAIEDGIPAIMTAHIVFPALDPTPGQPATLSYRILTGLLRQEMNFSGLIVTDALEMQAISNNFGGAEAAQRAFLAGADLLLIAWPTDPQHIDRAYRQILEAVRHGQIPVDRLEESLRRILAAKRSLAAKWRELPPASPDPATEAELAAEIARRAITLVRPTNLQPLNKEAPLCIVGPSAERLAPFFAEYTDKIKTVPVDPDPNLEERQAVLDQLRGEKTILLTTRQAFRNRGQQQLATEVAKLPGRVLVVALLEPYDLALIPGAETLLALYSDSEQHLQSLADLLYGQITALGKLPVTVEVGESPL